MWRDIRWIFRLFQARVLVTGWIALHAKILPPAANETDDDEVDNRDYVSGDVEEDDL
jgi:hypothetical protein